MVLDAVGVQYKRNTYHLARSHYACTSRGCKAGNVWVRFIVGMTYNKEKRMSSAYFAEIIDKKLSKALDASSNRSCRILKDSSPFKS